MKFVETAHIKDVLAFLRIAANPKDVVSWYRVLLLHEGVGPKTAQKILDELATARLTIKANPEQQLQFKYNDKIRKSVSASYINFIPKNNLPSEKLQMVLDYYYPIFKDRL